MSFTNFSRALAKVMSCLKTTPIARVPLTEANAHTMSIASLPARGYAHAGELPFRYPLFAGFLHAAGMYGRGHIVLGRDVDE